MEILLESDTETLSMCGRFTLILDPDALQEELDLGEVTGEYVPRYNIAPTQPVAVVRDSKERKVEFLRWGLIPSWAKDIEIGYRMINARAETLSEKPSFKSALAKRRNLILASGFYEWMVTDPASKSKTPIYVTLANNQPFAFAGLWDRWQKDDQTVFSTTIITTSANSLISEFHQRMPVILDTRNMWDWLSPELTIQEALSLLNPYPASAMQSHEVSDYVNNPAHEGLRCIQKADNSIGR